MEVAVNLDWLSGEMKSPALYGRPDAGLSLNRFNQMVSELEIVAKRETHFIHGPKTNRDEIELREINVSYEPHGAGGFSYGVRDFICIPSEDPHTDADYVAVAEASHTSLSIWESFVPEKHRKELYTW
ncbi:MAG: hypothetical protein AABX91_00950 [Nanoarchaeota archaeon]